MAISKPVILVLGMPGSGKTTVGKELATCLGIPFLSTGDVLRAGRASGLSLLYSSDPATSFLSSELRSQPLDFVNGFILDFSPVTINGNEQLEEMLRTLEFNISCVVYIRINIKIARERYISRGKRPGDPNKDMKIIFENRLLKEFWPFTIPIMQNAYNMQKLFTFDNQHDQIHLRDESKRMASVIRKDF